MQEIQPELIEKYQILLQKDPKSQIFAPLTEAYRKMGLLEEAFRIAVRGVQFNPAFGGGRIALARVFLERENLSGALDELEKARDLSPDNILAHLLLGECYLRTQRPKDALKAFKMVLFLAPLNEKAQKAVRKLESLTADEYEEDLFEMRQLPDFDPLSVDQPTPIQPVHSGSALGSELERILSLTDAYIVRNDLDRARGVLKQGEQSFGSHPELIKRMKLVNQRSFEPDSSGGRGKDFRENEGSGLNASSSARPDARSGAHSSADSDTTSAIAANSLPQRGPSPLDEKIDYLRGLLVRINEFAR